MNDDRRTEVSDRMRSLTSRISWQLIAIASVVAGLAMLVLALVIARS